MYLFYLYFPLYLCFSVQIFSAPFSYPFQLDLFQATGVDVYTMTLIACSRMPSFSFLVFLELFIPLIFKVISYYISFWSSAGSFVISHCLIIIFSLNLWSSSLRSYFRNSTLSLFYLRQKSVFNIFFWLGAYSCYVCSNCLICCILPHFHYSILAHMPCWFIFITYLLIGSKFGWEYTVKRGVGIVSFDNQKPNFFLRKVSPKHYPLGICMFSEEAVNLHMSQTPCTIILYLLFFHWPTWKFTE